MANANAIAPSKIVKKTSEAKEKEIDNEKDECTECGKNVTKDGIQCEICDRWNHSKCAGIKAEVYEFISSSAQIHWFCSKCNEGTGKMIKEIKRLQERVETLNHKLSSKRKKVKKKLKKFLTHRNRRSKRNLRKWQKK